jgi:hypothetical protein
MDAANRDILITDYAYLHTILFDKYTMKKVVCICNPSDPFVYTLLIKGSTHVQSIVLESDIEIANYIHTQYPDTYTIVRGVRPSDLEYDESPVFINTGNSEQDRTIYETVLKKNKETPVLVRFSSVKGVEGFNCVPISQDLAILVPFSANYPIQISVLPIAAFSYTFNSSCISISQDTFVPSMHHTEDSQLTYSFRTAMTKTCQSALGFCDSNGDIIPEFYQTDDIKRAVREDLRFFVWKGELYGSYTCIDPYISDVKTQQCLTVGKCMCSPEGIQIIEEFVPPYGGNLCNEPEKNWTWWESPGGALHCIYYFSPLKILSFSSLDSMPTEITHPDDLSLLKGHVRGGACGVVWDKKVWCFTHTNTDSGNFNIGIVVLSHEEVPRVLGWNHELVPSCEFGHAILYTCGALYCPENGSWHLSGGIQDSKCFTLHLPHEYICSRIQWVV